MDSFQRCRIAIVAKPMIGGRSQAKQTVFASHVILNAEMVETVEWGILFEELHQIQ